MVTLNVETDLGVANGARGTSVNTVLDPNEPEFKAIAPVVTLKYLPLYILVQMERTWAVTLLGLDPGVLLIVPASKTYRFEQLLPQNGRDPALVTKTVRRLQFPITPAYTFTD